MLSIVVSVIVVGLDSVADLRLEYGMPFIKWEWFFTILFTIEYALRIISVQRASGYIFSYTGLVDFFSILPTYLSLIIPGSQYFLVIRILRVFRVLKITQYLIEVHQLRQAMRSSRRKITVFVFTVVTIAVIVGSLMYVIEDPEHGFTGRW